MLVCVLQNNVEAASAFDGGVVEADNLLGLQNTCGNNASSCGTIDPQHEMVVEALVHTGNLASVSEGGSQ